MPTLRVATFNIRNGRAFDGWDSWPFRRRSTLAAIHDLDATVIGLQEVYAFQRRWLVHHMPEHTAHGLGRGRFGGEQCPVLVRSTKWKVSSHETRWFGPVPNRRGQRLPGALHPRIATTCTLAPTHVSACVGAEPVTVTNLHLDASSAERRQASVEQLLSWLDPDRPQVVMGDFNASATGALLDLLASGGLRAAVPTGADGTYHHFTGRREGPRLDHVFVNDRFQVTSAEVHRLATRPPFPSDHWPVVATLELLPRQGPPPR